MWSSGREEKVIQMLGFEITVKHQNQGLQQRCNHHHRRCGRRDHRARLAGKTAPAASKGKLPPVMASPKSLRGEKKMNPALFVDSIEEERKIFPRRFVRMCSFGDDFYSSFFCAKSVPFIFKTQNNLLFRNQSYTNRRRRDDDERGLDR